MRPWESRCRIADYAQFDTLREAFAGTDRLLLISASEVGQRLTQHRNAIEAAKLADVKLLAYTSMLHADSSPLALAVEHRQTETLLKESGAPFVALRNGWYTENDLASVSAALAHGVLLGSSGNGRIAWAARADYAAAAAAVLTAGEHSSASVYELAGDEAYTRSELAAEIARQSGKPVEYRNLPEADYTAALIGAGLPVGMAGVLADSDIGASRGGLFDDSHQLSRLIGRRTTPLAESVSAALAR